jgi:CHAT domain-containing protein/tetratricopeptide (TPR) repeat protein
MCASLAVRTRVGRGRSWPVAFAVIVCATAALVSQNAVEPAALLAVRQSLARGAFADAEREATALVAVVEQQSGGDSVELARVQDLRVEASTRSGHAGSPEILALAQRVVEVKEQHLGRGHPETASSLHNLGAVLFERGEFAAAVPLHERALAIRERALPVGDPAIARSLELLAAALIKTERPDDARRLLVRAQTIREANVARDPLGLATTLELTGWLERNSGNYTAAGPLVERALTLRRRAAPDHADLATTIELQGDLLWLTGDRVGARRVWSEAREFATRALGGDHPTLGAIERRAAMAAWAFGDQREARRLQEHALDVADRSAAPCYPERFMVLNDLAVSYEHGGEYSAASRMFERARAGYEKCLGPRHSLVATLISNQADLASMMGDLVESERLNQRVVEARTAAFGPTHPFVAGALESLADVVAARGQRARAQRLYDRALNIRRQGQSAPDVARTLVSMSRNYFASGKLTLASGALDEAMEIYRQAGSTAEQPDSLGRALELRAQIEARRGDYRGSRATLEETLDVRERTFGRSHPLSADTLLQLASADFALAARTAAFDEALAAERDARDHVRYTIRYLPERHAMLYAAKTARGVDLALSILASHEAGNSSQAFEAVIQSRGVILDELAARARLTASADPDLAPIGATLTAARERFANLMLRSLDDDGSVPLPLLDEARQAKERIERDLAERSVVIRGEFMRAHAALAEVSRALDPDSALVSFFRYERSVMSKSPGEALARLRTMPAYIAFVLRAGSSEVTAVPLGPAASLENAVTAWRAEAAMPPRAGAESTSETAYRDAGSRLRQRIWDPLAEAIGDVTRVFIVPDGALNLVSFAALPARAGGYLGERRAVHYVATERDLVTTELPPLARGLLAVGGAAFGGPPVKPAAAPVAPVVTPTLRSACANLAGVRFEPLPGSRSEVTEIARIWSSGPGAESQDHTGKATLLTGSAATETAFKQSVAGQRVVHLATHGFFLGSACDAAPPNTRAVGGLAVAGSQPRAPVENPLLLSGLAFAGANNRAAVRSNQDDGVLTAEEIAALNLQATEWAVLSACDTGLGEIKAGEGVFGLRRAFQIAGARTIVMSLWAVDDRATEAWMAALYSSRFGKRLSTADAVHDANLSVLRARRARGQSTHPFYWAGFVAAGDWR